MKRIAIALAAVSVTVAAQAQGTVNLNNHLSGTFDARVVLPDGTGASVGWSAQLYVQKEGTWQPVPPPTTFRTGNATGYVEPITVTVPGVRGGAQATLIVRAFNGAKFETSALRYESNPVTVVLGGAGFPPSVPADLIGLKTFKAVGPSELPTIVAQPQTQALIPGATITFSVEAKGAAPLSYQWKKNSAAISGATSATLVINNASTADLGRYTVVVSNAAGSVTSEEALLVSSSTVETGSVNFNNYIVGEVDVKVVLRDGTAVSTGWTAQLYGGPEGGTLVPLKPTTTFRTGVAAGYVNGVTVNVTGVKPGAKATLVMKVFNGATFETSSLRLESNPFTIAVGGGLLIPPNLAGLSKFTEVSPTPVSAFVLSVLPSGGYSPGAPLIVTLKASPSASTSVYAIEDRPPVNWVVGKVSDEGKFDAATGKVKFGPFFDSNPRTLTYEVTPPAREIGEKVFAGNASADGLSTVIGGDRRIDLIKLHPADNNPADSRLTINETTAYGAAWRKGATWTAGPNPIPIDYVTRAGTLWKNGEAYTIDSRISAPPLWWVNTSSGTLRGLGLQNYVSRIASPESVVSAAPARFVPGEKLKVRVSVKPMPGVSVYAVEDQIPRGVNVDVISDGGEFDSANRRVKWGPYFDGAPREMSYEIVTDAAAPDVLTLTGVASFDGVSLPTGGQRQSHAASRLVLRRQLPSGEFQMSVNGRQHQKYVIEVSTNLEDWTELTTAWNQNGTIVFSDPEAASASLRFYRAIGQ